MEGVRLGGLTILSVLVADDVVVSASLSRDSQWGGGWDENAIDLSQGRGAAPSGRV